MPNYIPDADAEFKSWAQNFVRKADDLGLPAALVSDLQSLEDAWSIQYPAHLRAQYAARAATISG